MGQAEIQPFPISTETILTECRIYQQWQKLYFNKDERHKEIKLPGPKEPGNLRGLFGSFLHIALVILRFSAALLSICRLQEWAAQKRIHTDSFSFEPEACGAHKAFTIIGLARLKSGDIEGAIQGLRASCRVHPCPHTTSFGLRKSLRNALAPYHQANETVMEYDSFAKEFCALR